MRHRPFLPVLAAVALAAPLAAQVSTPLDSTTLAGLRWRSIGPANFGGRVTDVEGIPSPSRTFFVATVAGGIWKTTNAGTTFRPLFEHEDVISMGDIAIAPSDTNIIWAGTGEEDSRNSISPGGGIYKSTDGGLTWQFMGLKATQAIGRIIVHPTNPDIVYVAALGHVWGPNPERGVYKTTDGGTTWQLVKFVNDRAGFVDLAMDPTNPDVLFASSWERYRTPYSLQSGGPGSGLWKTTDAGKTWTEIKGGGFPDTMKGRIGIAIAPSDHNVVYALVEADTAPNASKEKKARQQRPSGLYRSADGGATWTKMNDRDTRPFYYSQVRVDPKDPNRVYWSSTPVNFSDDGGKTVRNATLGIHVDHHAMWIDPNDPAHFIVGDDGGVSQTWDRGGNYDFLNLMAIGQAYEVSFDMAIPYHVCGGFQDNGSWCGPSRKRRGDITNYDWMTVGGGDGFYTAQDPTDPNTIYSESQGGNVGRLDLASGERTALNRPDWRPRYQLYEDSIVIERPDTTAKETRAQERRIAELTKRQQADSTDEALRYNWDTPYFLSPHNPNTIYLGANKVLKSTDRGDHFYPISPDLTTNDTMAIRVSTSTTGGITRDVTGAETYGTIITLAESPVRPGLLYAGTDDGNVWLTRNDGGAWENLTGRFPGLPSKTWVSRIEPSHFDTATFYVAFDNHRRNDFAPYVYVTSDFGKTFRSIAGGLPTGGVDYVHVIREDLYNPHLLFVGTDIGAYVSMNDGTTWQKFMAGLPTVPVHDLKIHPRDHELIAATHGRSFWIVDIAPLEQLSDSVLAAVAYLFQPTTAYEYGERPIGGETPGQKFFRAPSPEYGAAIMYRLASGNPRSPVHVVIQDVKGDTLRSLRGAGGPGLHQVTWDFRGPPPAAEPLSPSQKRDSIIAARRRDYVLDSLENAGMPKPFIERLRQSLASGNVRSLFQRFGGGGGGGVFQGGRFVERPGESPLRGGGRRAGAPSQGQGRQAGQEMPANMGSFRDILRLLRPPGQRGFGGFGRGRRGAPSVAPGDYLVSITVDGKTMSRVLRVERANGAGNDVAAFEEDNR